MNKMKATTTKNPEDSQLDLLLTRMESLEDKFKDLLKRLPLQTDLDYIRESPTKFEALTEASNKNAADAKYARETTATNIAQFRGEFENFQLSGHPSFTSAIDKLTSFLQQNSVATESVINKSPTLSDPSCPSFITCYVSFLHYKDKNGFLTFGQILKKTPSILRIFHEKIHSKDPTYHLSLDFDDFYLFREVLSKVFYPHGFPVEGFQLLISANPMTSPITVQSAYSYALFIKDVTDTLNTILPQAETLVLKCWDIVRQGIDQKHELHYKLLSEHPQSYDRFYYTLDKKIKSFFESPPIPISSTNPLPYSSPSRGQPHVQPHGNTSAYQHRSHGNYSGGSHSVSPHSNHSGAQMLSVPSSLSSPQRTTITNVSINSSSCENCGILGHYPIECDKDFCRPCYQTDDSSGFFHRPRDCVQFDCYHEKV